MELSFLSATAMILGTILAIESCRAMDLRGAAFSVILFIIGCGLAQKEVNEYEDDDE